MKKRADWRLIAYGSFAVTMLLLDGGITQLHYVGLQFLAIACSQVAVALMLFDGDSQRDV